MKKLAKVLAVVLAIAMIACPFASAEAQQNPAVQNGSKDALSVTVKDDGGAKKIEVTYEAVQGFAAAILVFDAEGVAAIGGTDVEVTEFTPVEGTYDIQGNIDVSGEASLINDGAEMRLIIDVSGDGANNELPKIVKVVAEIPVTISNLNEFSVTATNVQAGTDLGEDGAKLIETDITNEYGVIDTESENVKAEASKEDLHIHDFTGSWQSDEEGHWHNCIAAGCTDPVATDDKIPHTAAYENLGEGTHKVYCSECDYVITAVENHNYVEGVCACGAEEPVAHEHVFGELQYKVEGGNCITYKECECGETETVASIANLELKPNLVLASGLSIRFRIPKTSLSAYSNIYGSFTKDVYSGATCTGVSAEEIISAVDQGNAQTGNKQFEYKGIASYEMTATIHAKIFATNGNGVVVLVSALEYQFADYFKSNIAGGVTGTTNTKERLDFYANTLRYGSASQIRNNYNTSDLADKLLDGSFGTDLPTTFTNTDAVSSGSVTIEPNAVVGNSLMFRIRFLKSAVSQVNDLKLSISYTNASGVATTLVVDQFTDASNGTKYQYEFSDLPCAFIGDYFTVKILDGTTEVASLQYCFQKYASEKYATSVTNPTETNRTLGTLCQAIIAYSTSAKAVFVK